MAIKLGFDFLVISSLMIWIHDVGGCWMVFAMYIWFKKSQITITLCVGALSWRKILVLANSVHAILSLYVWIMNYIYKPMSHVQ